MDKNGYDELISKISKKLAKEILKNKKQLDKQALLLDADIAEITRKIGLETVQKIYESLLEEHVALKKKKKN
jgi:flagellar biosynthesis component FlhA